MRERVTRRCGNGFLDKLRGGRIKVLRRLRLHGRLASGRCRFLMHGGCSSCTTKFCNVERAMKKFSYLHFLLDVLMHEIPKGKLFSERNRACPGRPTVKKTGQVGSIQRPLPVVPAFIALIDLFLNGRLLVNVLSNSRTGPYECVRVMFVFFVSVLQTHGEFLVGHGIRRRPIKLQRLLVYMPNEHEQCKNHKQYIHIIVCIYKSQNDTTGLIPWSEDVSNGFLSFKR